MDLIFEIEELEDLLELNDMINLYIYYSNLIQLKLYLKKYLLVNELLVIRDC
jgi:hypothetical protein